MEAKAKQAGAAPEPSKLDVIIDKIRAYPPEKLAEWAMSFAPNIAQFKGMEIAKIKSVLIECGLDREFVEGDLSDEISDHRVKFGGGEPGTPNVIGGCIYIKERTKEGDRNTRLCNFDARILSNVSKVDDDLDTAEMFTTIGGTLASGKPLRTITIPASEFDSLGWIASQWAQKAIISPGRGIKENLRYAIQTLSADTLTERSIYLRTGWATIDGKRVYLHGGGAVGGSVETELPGRLAEYTLPADDDHKIDPVTAIKASLALLDIGERSITMPLLAAMYAAPLSEMVRNDFMVTLEGVSGDGKTTLATLLLSHFGSRWSSEFVPESWASTAGEIERRLCIMKDAPLLIDDNKPPESQREAEESAQKVSRIIRAVGNQVGRSRMPGIGKERASYDPRGLAFMTAELSPEGGSTESRVAKIKMHKSQIDSGKLFAAIDNRDALRYAMRYYIAMVAQDWDSVAAYHKKTSAETDALLVKGTVDAHGRITSSTAILYSAFCIFTHMAVKAGALTTEDQTALRNEYLSLALASATDRANDLNRNNQAEKYMASIATLLIQGRVRISGRTTPEFYGGLNGLVIGFHDAGRILIIPDASLAAIKQLHGTQTGQSTLNKSALGSMLAVKGWLAKRDKESLQVQLKVPVGDGPMQNARLFDISYTRLDNLLAEYGQSLMSLKRFDSSAFSPEDKD